MRMGEPSGMFRIAVAMGATAVVLAGAALPASAWAVCANAEERLIATGVGDRDDDGLANCTERKRIGTDPRDFDSDDDGLADGRELFLGTDPLDADSDDDGEDDGSEHESEEEIEGSLQSVVCPTLEGDGTLTVLCIDVMLTPDTRYEGVVGCEGLTELLGSGASVEVEVEVAAAEACGSLVATKVEIEGDHGDGDDGQESDDDHDEDGDDEDDDDDDDDSTGSGDDDEIDHD